MLIFISFFLPPEGLLPETSALLPHLDWFPSRLKIAPRAFFQYYSVLGPMSPLLSSHDLGVGPRFARAHHEKDTGVVKIWILQFWMSLIFISQWGTKYFRNHFLSEFCRLCYIAFSSLYVSNFLICNFLFGEFQDFFLLGGVLRFCAVILGGAFHKLSTLWVSQNDISLPAIQIYCLKCLC